MRLLVLLLVTAGLAPAPEMRPHFVQAVEFPYYSYPKWLWERELVWLKNLGIDTVEFSVPWNWHQVDPDTLDLTGQTRPGRDLIGFLRLLKRVGLRAWMRPVPPVKGWIRAGYPRGMEGDQRGLRKWLWDLESALSPLEASHGGPIAMVEGGGGIFDAPAPPQPVREVPARDSRALIESREAFAAGRGSLVWTDVEDTLVPAGWEPAAGAVFRPGAVSFAGDERVSVTPLRRDALLSRYWGAALGSMHAAAAVRPVTGRLSPGIVAQQLVSPSDFSVLSVVNASSNPVQQQLRVIYPPSQRRIVLPELSLAPGEVLWLPVHLPLNSVRFCRDCSVFSNLDHIVYSTAELNALEYENGILAMEFAAPQPGEVLLQLSRTPSGPLLAAGRPTKFDWDEKSMRARLPVPAGKGPAFRVRIGFAIQPPETSAFFANASRLIIGAQNSILTSYSSEQVAQRSRLTVPESFRVASTVKSPLEIEYEIDVPTDAVHGEWAQLALESDGVLMSRARLQVLRPAALRVREAINLHFGSQAQLAPSPPLVPIEATGREISVVVHNNFPEIRNYTLTAAGDGLEFSPQHAEVSIGAGMERDVSIRIFPKGGGQGLVSARLELSGAADVDLPLRLVVIPRGQAVAYTTDLDGDGRPEWVLENHKARAVFSSEDGGRWLEFVWKDSNTNVLADTGALVGTGAVMAQVSADGPEAVLEFSAKDWRRTVRLDGNSARLIVEQTTPVAAVNLKSDKKNEVLFRAITESAQRAVYSLERAAE